MKLDPECIRALLLSIEDKCTPSTPWNYKYQNPTSDFISDENYEKIFHHILQLRNLDGYLNFLTRVSPCFMAELFNQTPLQML